MACLPPSPPSSGGLRFLSDGVELRMRTGLITWACRCRLHMVLLLITSACTPGEEQAAGVVDKATPPPSAPSSSDLTWYQGGTLHQATVADWKQATEHDRLATAADFASSILEPNTVEEVREPAEEMKDCLAEAVQGAPDYKNMSELAAVCAVMMGWQKGSLAN